MNLQVIASPDGTIVWVSGPLPGSVHDLKAARIWGLIRQLGACGFLVLAQQFRAVVDHPGPHIRDLAPLAREHADEGRALRAAESIGIVCEHASQFSGAVISKRLHRPYRLIFITLPTVICRLTCDFSGRH